MLQGNGSFAFLLGLDDDVAAPLGRLLEVDADGDTRQADLNAALEPPFQEPPPHGLKSCDLDVLDRGIQVGHGSFQVGAVKAVA